MTKDSEQVRKKYPYIVAWGKLAHSFEPYVTRQCFEAEIAGAPEDACYYNGNKKKWEVAGEMRPELQEQLKSLL